MINAVSQPFQAMTKPTGAICNLDCSYCYFLAKEMLYPGSRFRMADETLRTYVRQYIEAQPVPEVTFVWQGGEPTLIGLPFFERVVALQQEFKRPGMRIHNSLQTNATLLDDAWGAFFREHQFLVGVSLDGPRELNDRFRVDKGGVGTFDRVMKGIDVLKRFGVEFNILATVHAGNQNHPLEVYRFFRDELSARFLQFIPIVERLEDGRADRDALVTDRSVDPARFGRFMSSIYDEWVRHDVGTVFVQLFDVTLGKHIDAPGGLCVFEETCGRGLAVEHNGDVYACDHFVEPDHLLGNLEELPLVELANSDQQRAFGEAKRDTLPSKCISCDVRWLCHGGCPKDRFTTTPDGEPGLNYLCDGYFDFFSHTMETMTFMASELRFGRPASNVMHRVDEAPSHSATASSDASS